MICFNKLMEWIVCHKKLLLAGHEGFTNRVNDSKYVIYIHREKFVKSITQMVFKVLVLGNGYDRFVI